MVDTLISRQDQAEELAEDALREVLAIERQAQGIIRDAEAEAQRIVAAAQQRAKETKETTEAAARQQAEAKVRESAAETEKLTRAIIEQAEQEADKWARSAETCYADALSFVLDAINLREKG